MNFQTIADYGQTVYILKNNALVKCSVRTIVIKQYTEEKIIIEYKLRADDGNMFSEHFDESLIFLTKEDLVKDLLSDQSMDELIS